MKRRAKEVLDADRSVSSHFFLQPRTIIHLSVVLVHLIILLLGAWYNHWPKFCLRNNWVYFSLIGLHVSAVINVLATFLTYVIFEDLNWVLLSTLLFVYGLLFTACGVIYAWDEFDSCIKCMLPYMRIFPEDVDEEWLRTKLDFSVPSQNRDPVENTIGYSTFMLGILHIILLTYYLIRKEKA